MPAKSKSSSNLTPNRLLTLVVAVVLVVFAVLVTRQVIDLKNRHSGRTGGKSSVPPTLAPSTQFSQ